MPDRYFILISNCEILPDQDTFCDGKWEYIFGHDDASLLPHSHDFHAAILMGLQYAACYQMDFLYIEQDCIAFGLDKMIAWAQENIGDKLIIYGFGEWSYQPGWAEQSLMYIPNHAIQTVISIMLAAAVHTQQHTVPEVLWHNLFRNYMIAWPFGYGRHPVRNWNDPMFYRQQVSDIDISRFLSLGANQNGNGKLLS
ncbi:MAG: hypothetical protein ONB13_05450 [candidate division KSB1 bacterium]|nr:hypothetical protein [candidate division KSB1 bacterium]